jgi:tryptophanyl-tRNA synthetase
MKYLSGIQPSGNLHIGNYFGAIRQHLESQDENSAYFIANYHALTSLHNAKELEQYTLEVAATYLALGLDPHKCVFFKQSDVPEVTELCFILSTVTGMGLLQRGHAYKDKVENGLPASLGLFSYPVLMAADILMFDTQFVPVGGDQVQHVEIAADIAGSFNAAVGQDILAKPAFKVSPATKVLGLDGQKMSKSYHNTIPIFSKDYGKYVSKIKTDGMNFRTQPLTVDGDITFHLLSLFLTPAEQDVLKVSYLEDRSFGYGHAKKILIQKLENTFGEAQRKFDDLMAHPNIIKLQLDVGGRKAREIAQRKMRVVREVLGI